MLVLRENLVQPAPREFGALKEYRDLRVTLEHKETRVPRDSLALMELRVTRVSLDAMEIRDLLESGEMTVTF